MTSATKEEEGVHQILLSNKMFYFIMHPPEGPKVRGVAPVGAMLGVH